MIIIIIHALINAYQASMNFLKVVLANVKYLYYINHRNKETHLIHYL